MNESVIIITIKKRKDGFPLWMEFQKEDTDNGEEHFP